MIKQDLDKDKLIYTQQNIINITASEINNTFKCLECKEILILSWLNEKEKIFLCSNKNVNKFKRFYLKYSKFL